MERIIETHEIPYDEFPLQKEWKSLLPQEVVEAFRKNPLIATSFHQIYNNEQAKKIFNTEYVLSLKCFHFGRELLGQEMRIMIPTNPTFNKLLATSDCFHDWYPTKKIGNCLHIYECSKCGAQDEVDSS